MENDMENDAKKRSDIPLRTSFKLIIEDFVAKYLSLGNDRENIDVTLQEIKSNIEFKGSNVWILIFAIFIASLGLNVNSTAVIIGAMLISPLMGPIMGIGLGLGINDFELIKKSAYNLAIATLFSIITSTLYFLVSPLNEARSELLARTAPTIYDVLIAFFGGLAGIVALSTKQKGNVLPGVAIATALMPPLCTAGFGLATGNMSYFIGAFYLYCINSVFISIATTLGVNFMKFPKKNFVDKVREKKVKRIVYMILIITTVPSVIITYNMIKDSLYETKVNNFVATQLNFPQTQILKKESYSDHGEHYIAVSLVGKEVPTDTILQLQNRMSNFGLKNTKLLVSQGYQGDEIDLQSLSNKMFKDIYQDNQSRIANQENQIELLQSKIDKLQRYDSLAIAISPELRVLYPDIEEIAISRQVFSEVSSQQLDTVMLVVARSSKQMAKTKQEHFKEWLEVRIGTKKLRLIVEK